MKYLDATLPTADENLAWDEMRLAACERQPEGEVLRVWEARETFVVMGYSNRAEQEVHLEACHARGVQVLKRCSGGGTVLQGPGCLNYALILKIKPASSLSTISGANQFIMERHRQLMAELTGQPVQIEGHTDLALGGRKFSGNAQRRRKNHLLFHGTFLLNFDLSQMDAFLRFPSKPPPYRRDRSHADFLINLRLKAETVKSALRRAWNAR